MDSLLESLMQMLWRTARDLLRFLATLLLWQVFDRTAGRYVLWPIIEWCIVRPFWLAVDIVCLATRTLTALVIKLFPSLDMPRRRIAPALADPRYDALRRKLRRDTGRRLIGA